MGQQIIFIVESMPTHFRICIIRSLEGFISEFKKPLFHSIFRKVLLKIFKSVIHLKADETNIAHLIQDISWNDLERNVHYEIQGFDSLDKGGEKDGKQKVNVTVAFTWFVWHSILEEGWFNSNANKYVVSPERIPPLKKVFSCHQSYRRLRLSLQPRIIVEA